MKAKTALWLTRNRKYLVPAVVLVGAAIWFFMDR